MNKRNHYSASFKTQVVLDVLREEATINEIAAQHGIHPGMINRWKKEFLERASEVFKKGPSEAEQDLKKAQKHVAELERKIGQLAYEVDWLKKKSEEINRRKRP